MRKINLRYRSVQQDLEELIDSGCHPEPLSEEVVKEAERKAKEFLKRGRYENS